MPDASPAPQTPLSPSSTDGTESSFAGTSFEDVVLQNSSDFYRWLSELEAARSSETEEKFRRYGTALERHLATADGLLATVKEVGAGQWPHAGRLRRGAARERGQMWLPGAGAIGRIPCMRTTLDVLLLPGHMAPRPPQPTPSHPQNQVLDLFERLREQHRTVATRTSALHSTCERLVAERSRLEELAGAIRSKLAYFDELEAVAAQVRRRGQRSSS